MKSWGLTANLSEFSVKLCTFTFNKLQQFLNLFQYTGGKKEVPSCLSNRFFPHPFKIQKNKCMNQFYINTNIVFFQNILYFFLFFNLNTFTNETIDLHTHTLTTYLCWRRAHQSDEVSHSPPRSSSLQRSTPCDPLPQQHGWLSVALLLGAQSSATFPTSVTVSA